MRKAIKQKLTLSTQNDASAFVAPIHSKTGELSPLSRGMFYVNKCRLRKICSPKTTCELSLIAHNWLIRLQIDESSNFTASRVNVALNFNGNFFMTTEYSQ